VSVGRVSANVSGVSRRKALRTSSGALKIIGRPEVPREFVQRSTTCVWTKVVLVGRQRPQQGERAAGVVLPLSRELLKCGVKDIAKPCRLPCSFTRPICGSQAASLWNGKSRTHLLVTAKVMRRILIDHARARKSERGAGRRSNNVSRRKPSIGSWDACAHASLRPMAVIPRRPEAGWEPDVGDRAASLPRARSLQSECRGGAGRHFAPTPSSQHPDERHAFQESGHVEGVR
jgi:ECF sigma factor